jgi:lipopolysaccharide biosynthesis glycosyltransferase
MEKNTPYINSGVLLMNLQMLRKHMHPEEIYEYIHKHKQVLLLPDQDVLSALYGKKTLLVDSLLYNLTEKYVRAYNFRLLPGAFKINLDWIRSNTVIIHYCGKNKPWKTNYLGNLNGFYDEIAQQLAK